MTRGKHLGEKIITQLQKLNDDLTAFIRSSVETSTYLGRLTSLANDFKPLRCWEAKGCTKTTCPAYGNGDYRCWLHAGTLCGGEVQGDFAQKYSSCFECDLYETLQAADAKMYQNKRGKHENSS